MSLKLRWVNKLNQERKEEDRAENPSSHRAASVSQRQGRRMGDSTEMGRKEGSEDERNSWVVTSVCPEAGEAHLQREGVGQVSCKRRMMGMVKVVKAGERRVGA